MAGRRGNGSSIINLTVFCLLRPLSLPLHHLSPATTLYTPSITLYTSLLPYESTYISPLLLAHNPLDTHTLTHTFTHSYIHSYTLSLTHSLSHIQHAISHTPSHNAPSLTHPHLCTRHTFSHTLPPSHATHLLSHSPGGAAEGPRGAHLLDLLPARRQPAGHRPDRRDAAV